MKTILEFLDDGSARRFLAFLAALVVICLTHYLQLGADALTALTTLTLGYIGQGTVKAIMQPDPPPSPDPVLTPQ